MQRTWTLKDIADEAAAFDWSKVDAMTDEEIIAAAKADPDCELPTDEELADFKPVTAAKGRRASREEAAE